MQYELYVDKDLDRTFDDFFYQTADFAQAQRLPAGIVKVGLEDRPKAKDADYNDYIFAIEPRNCSPNRIRADLTDTPVCGNSCSVACPEGWTGTSSQRFRVAAALSIDDSFTESKKYEPIGRKLALTVALYSDFLPGELRTSRAVAVCPTVNFNWRGVSRLYRGGFAHWSLSDGTCNRPTVPSEVASCRQTSAGQTLPLSLSVEQNRERDPCANAGNSMGGKEIVLLEESACAPKAYLKEYEFRINDLDAIIGDPTLAYGTASSAEIEKLVQSIDVRVFLNLPNDGQDFRCPSGVGASWGDNQPQNGDILHFQLIQGGTSGLNIIRQGQ